MGTYPGVLQSYRTENCPQESSFSPVKEIIPPDSITPGNRPETAKFAKFGDPLGNVPGNPYLCRTKYPYSVSKGNLFTHPWRGDSGGIFLSSPGLPDLAPTATPPPGVRIKLPTTLQIWHKCRTPGGRYVRRFSLEKLLSYLRL